MELSLNHNRSGIKRIAQAGVIAFATLFCQFAQAVPPLWEAAYAVTELDGTNARPFANAGPSRQINGQESVVLGFNFPFGGVNYDRISVDSDGAIVLKNDDSLTDVPSTTWNKVFFQTNFSNLGQGSVAPVIMPFNTALDQLATGGRVYYALYSGNFMGAFTGNRGVITWESSTLDPLDPTADITFQVQLFDDGTIIFSYQTLTSPAGSNWEDPANASAGIVIGISNGDGTWPTGSQNLSNVDFGVDLIGYEIWCQNDDPNNPATCMQAGRPRNNGFDLHDLSIVFNPDGNTGFLVSNTIQNGAGSGGSGVCPVFRAPGADDVVNGGNNFSGGGGGGSGSGGSSFGPLALVFMMFLPYIAARFRPGRRKP